jgi:hypothetical protein
VPVPFLSIIIPAYNEEHRLPKTINQVVNFLESQPYTWEILIVDNHSTDQTPDVISSFQAEIPGLRGLYEAEKGKGSAVRRGMLKAEGEYRFMCDADLSMPITEVNRFLPPAVPSGQITIASREAPGSVRYHEPYYRHLGGRLINLIIRLLVLPDLHDTQCGFKCFPASIARDLFSHQTIPGWSFDIEILAVARLRGYPIREIPIPWHYNPDTKLKAFPDAIRMTRDIFQIRRQMQLGVYDQEIG